MFRLAINRSRILSGTADWSGFDYLGELDAFVERAARGGAYTLLSLRRLDDVTAFGTRVNERGERVGHEVAPQPDFDSIGMWRLLAERYAGEPAVLYDLYTAPHAPLDDDLSGYHTNWDLWTLWLQLTIADMQLVHPAPLCFVAGLEDGTDFSGFPIRGTAGDPIPGLVYSAHLAPGSSGTLTRLRALGRAHPVFVTEWGGRDSHLTWGEQTATMLAAAGIGWTAAHLNAEPLLARAAAAWAPTTFGRVVQRALAVDASTPLGQPRVAAALPAAF